MDRKREDDEPCRGGEVALQLPQMDMIGVGPHLMQLRAAVSPGGQHIREARQQWRPVDVQQTSPGSPIWSCQPWRSELAVSSN